MEDYTSPLNMEEFTSPCTIIFYNEQFTGNVEFSLHGDFTVKGNDLNIVANSYFLASYIENGGTSLCKGNVGGTLFDATAAITNDRNITITSTKIPLKITTIVPNAVIQVITDLIEEGLCRSADVDDIELDYPGDGTENTTYQ